MFYLCVTCIINIYVPNMKDLEVNQFLVRKSIRKLCISIHIVHVHVFSKLCLVLTIDNTTNVCIPRPVTFHRIADMKSEWQYNRMRKWKRKQMLLFYQQCWMHVLFFCPINIHFFCKPCLCKFFLHFFYLTKELSRYREITHNYSAFKKCSRKSIWQVWFSSIFVSQNH